MPRLIPDEQRPPEERYVLYARRGDDLRELACSETPAGLGSAIVQLHEDGKELDENGKAKKPRYRLYEEGVIGILDSQAHEWIVLPWPRGGSS